MHEDGKTFVIPVSDPAYTGVGPATKPIYCGLELRGTIGHNLSYAIEHL